MLKELTDNSPIMHSEKAVNYFKVYAQRGIDRFGYHYTKSIDELAWLFARQPLDFNRFLKMIRAEEAGKRLKQHIE